MNNTINLFRNRQKMQVGRGKIFNTFRNISIVSLVVVSLFSVLLFILNTNPSLLSLQRQEAKLLSSLSSSHPKAVKLLYIEERAKGIASIIEKRPLSTESLNTVLAVVPASVSVKSFTVDKKSVLVTASSSSLLAIDTLLNALVGMISNKKVFKSVTLDTLIVDAKLNQYVVSFSADLL